MTTVNTSDEMTINGETLNNLFNKVVSAIMSRLESKPFEINGKLTKKLLIQLICSIGLTIFDRIDSKAATLVVSVVVNTSGQQLI